MNSTDASTEQFISRLPSLAYSKYIALLWCLALPSLIVYGIAADKIDRRGYKHYPVLGDCSWWRRRAWFFCRWSQDSMNLLYDGYEKYTKKNAIWATWIFDDLFYVFPPNMVDELKSFPPDKLNFSKIVDDQFLWHLYMGKTLTDREYVTAVNRHLVSNLPEMSSLLDDFINKAMLQHLSPPPDSRGWQVVSLWDSMLDICHRVVGQVMVGELGSSQGYLHHATGFTETITAWSGTMFTLPSWLRVAYFRFSRGGREVRYHLRETKNIVIPELQRLESEVESGEVSSMIQCFLKYSSAAHDASGHGEIVNQMLILTFAAAAMWDMILCQVIQNYLAYPEYQKELKQEVAQALSDHGGWTKQAFLNMPKLDCFIRETLRCNPPIIFTIQRKVMQEVQLSNNTVLEPGEKVMVPTYAILRDPDIYQDPDTFNPYRFYDADKNVAKILPMTQTSEFPVFGFGNQTCPGRFFGSLATKIAFARLVTDYDVKFVPERVGKPVDWPLGATLMPNVDTFVAFRRRAQS